MTWLLLRAATNARSEERESSWCVATRRRESDMLHPGVSDANMSHEIRTPLNAIVGFSSTSLSMQSGAVLGGAQYCAIVVGDSEMLLTLLNGILIISSTLECGRFSSTMWRRSCRSAGNNMMTNLAAIGRGCRGALRLRCRFVRTHALQAPCPVADPDQPADRAGLNSPPGNIRWGSHRREYNEVPPGDQ